MRLPTSQWTTWGGSVLKTWRKPSATRLFSFRSCTPTTKWDPFSRSKRSSISRTIAASCIDAANPCVFVSAGDLGLTGVELPTALEDDAVFLERMEAIRQAASVAMGLAADLEAARKLASIPKVAIVSAPQPSPTLSGRRVGAGEMDIAVRMISVGQPHRAVPITGAVCLAVAARVPGSIPHRLCASKEGPIRIGHASGTNLVEATVQDGKALNGAVFRSARRLFEGNVIYRAP